MRNSCGKIVLADADTGVRFRRTPSHNVDRSRIRDTFGVNLIPPPAAGFFFGEAFMAHGKGRSRLRSINGSHVGDLEGIEIQIEEGAEVRGNIKARVVKIVGSVEGDIEADCVYVAAKGSLRGVVTARVIGIIPGANVDGFSFRRATSPAPANAIEKEEVVAIPAVVAASEPASTPSRKSLAAVELAPAAPRTRPAAPAPVRASQSTSAPSPASEGMTLSARRREEVLGKVLKAVEKELTMPDIKSTIETLTKQISRVNDRMPSSKPVRPEPIRPREWLSRAEPIGEAALVRRTLPSLL